MLRKSILSRPVWLMALVGGLLLAACAPQALPSSPAETSPGETTSQPFEILGAIESQSATAWTISGQTVRVDAATQIEGQPAIGSFVQAEGQVGQDGALLAREIKLAQAPAATPGAEVEFTGEVSSIGPEVWVIGGQTVRVNAQTEIKPGVRLGVFVKVHALPQSDGSLLAREIELAEAQAEPTATGEFEFTGVLTAINQDVWTVGAFEVFVYVNTEIKGNPQIGDVVKVHAFAQADGALVAREIEVEADQTQGTGTPAPTLAAEVEFEGVLTAINNGVWTIGGRNVFVFANTEIKGNPQVGNVVKVHAFIQADGALVAREVEVEDDEPQATGTPIPAAEFEFTGVVEAISGNVWTVGGLSVTITANTEIKDNPQVGELVKVHALQQADGSLVAREIEKENNGSGGGDDGGDDDHSGSGGGGDDGGDDDHGGGGDDDNSGSGDDDGGDDDHSGNG